MLTDAATYALIGIIVGAIATVLARYMKGRIDYRRELLRLDVETAHRDFETALNLPEARGKSPFPLSSYIAYDYTFLSNLHGGLSPSDAAEDALPKLEALLSAYTASGLSPYAREWVTTQPRDGADCEVATAQP